MHEIERMLGLLKRATRMWRIDEAALLCDCSERKIWRAINCGQIQAARIGDGDTRIPHSKIVKFCDGRDPLLEFQVSVLQLENATDYYVKRIEALEALIERLEQQLALFGTVCQ